jgi:hypothetical protein
MPMHNTNNGDAIVLNITDDPIRIKVLIMKIVQFHMVNNSGLFPARFVNI